MRLRLSHLVTLTLILVKVVETFTLVVRDHQNTAITLTTAADTSGAGTDVDTTAELVEALKLDADYANAYFTLSNDGAKRSSPTQKAMFRDANSANITLTRSTGNAITGTNDGLLDGSVDFTAAATRTQGAGPAKIKIDTDARTSDLVYTITLGSHTTDATVVKVHRNNYFQCNSEWFFWHKYLCCRYRTNRTVTGFYYSEWNF